MLQGLKLFEWMETYLVVSVDVAGMTLIEGPYTYWNGLNMQGYCILAESHSSIHIQQGYVFGDLFSCQHFEPHRILQCVEDMLDMRVVQYRVLHRGLEFLNPVSVANGQAVDD